MRSIGHFIGGKEVKGTSGRTADVFEPMTGDVQAKVALASKAEVRAAVENARAAQSEWAATNPQRAGPYYSRDWCIDKYDEAARKFLGKPAAQIPWTTKIERPGVMDLITVADVTAKLDKMRA